MYSLVGGRSTVEPSTSITSTLRSIRCCTRLNLSSDKMEVMASGGGKGSTTLLVRRPAAMREGGMDRNEAVSKGVKVEVGGFMVTLTLSIDGIGDLGGIFVEEMRKNKLWEWCLMEWNETWWRYKITWKRGGIGIVKTERSDGESLVDCFQRKLEAAVKI